MLKVIPCILLTYLSFALIKVLYRANQRRQRLKHGVDYNTVVSSNFSQNLIMNNSQSCDRTTRMLVAILIMFLIAEIPNGTVALLSGIYADEFHMVVYNNLGEVLDMLALFNSAINFILYCTMSRQFRKVFVKLFCTTVIVASEPANHLMTNHHHNKHKRQSQPLVDPHTCQTTFV